MLSITRITASRAILIVPKAAVSSGISTRFFSLASDLQSKKKVEEDRWIRSTEHEAYLKRKAAASVVHPVMTAEELAAKELHATTVDEAFGILSKTGCKVEDVTVEALAAWKLGE